MQDQAIIDFYKIEQKTPSLITLETTNSISDKLYTDLLLTDDYILSVERYSRSKSKVRIEITFKGKQTIDRFLELGYVRKNLILPVVSDEESTNNTEYIANVRQVIGSWIKEYRERKGITQTELADRLGITFGTVSKIESGKWISLEIVIKIALELDFYPVFLENKKKDDLLEIMVKHSSQKVK
jgi:DNA-binding XRE family transcriptional regulator